MVAVPADTPVITPVFALTVAIAVLLVDHVPPDTVDVKVVLLPTGVMFTPAKVPAFGGIVTVTVLVAIASAQLPEPATV